MSLLICQFFYIFVLYFQVVLSINPVGTIREIYKSMVPLYQEQNGPGTKTSFRPHNTPPQHKKVHTKIAHCLISYHWNFFMPLIMWHAGLVHCNQLKPVLARITQHHTVINDYTVYDLKHIPFEYYTHYDHIKYAWAERRKVPHNPIYKWEEEEILKHEPV